MQLSMKKRKNEQNLHLYGVNDIRRRTQGAGGMLHQHFNSIILATLYEKRRRNLKNNHFSSIRSPKISLLGTMGEHKKGPVNFSGYQNSILLLI